MALFSNYFEDLLLVIYCKAEAKAAVQAIIKIRDMFTDCDRPTHML